MWKPVKPIIFPIGNMLNIHSTEMLGMKVRNARKQAGLRQDDLAGAAGVGTRFVVELEAGKPTLQLGKVLAVIAALGLTLALTSDTAK